MRTSLLLDRHNEDLLVNYFMERHQGCRDAYDASNQGLLNQRAAPGLVGGVMDSWIGIRLKAMAQWKGDFSWRATIQDSVYQLSNKSLNTVRRVIRAAAAKVVADIVGSDPFFGLIPQGPEDDPKLCQDVERWGHEQARKANARHVYRSAILGALIRGESVVKRRYNVHESKWVELVVIAHTAEGEPIGDSKRGPIYQTDDLMPHASLKGVMVLVRDPETFLPPDVKWLGVRMPRSEINQSIELEQVYWSDFYCNTTEEDIHKADYIGQSADVSYYTIADMVRGPNLLDPAAAQELLDAVKNQQTSVQSQKSLPDAKKGEDVTRRGNLKLPAGYIIESYGRVDADGDGSAEEIFAVIEKNTGRPVFYDYLNAVFKDKKRPFDVIRTDPVEGRWYGTGLYEANAPLNEFIELLFNRINLRCSNGGRINFSNPQATKETAAGEKISFGNPTKNYTLNDGFTKDDAYSYVIAPEIDEKATALMQMCLQAIQLETGEITAGDGNLSGLPSTNLATGIRSLERQAASLMKDMLMTLSQGVSDSMEGFLSYCIAYMNEEEAFNVMQADAPKLIQLKRQDVQKLKYLFRLLLTPSRGDELLEASKQRIDIATQYHELLITNPSAAASMRSLFIQELTALETQDIDTILPPVVLPPQGGALPPESTSQPQPTEQAQAV